jgi:hypothetical protein
MTLEEATLRIGGGEERRDEGLEGTRRNSRTGWEKRRSKTRMERRRAIVYRASGRPSRVEVYMQARGLPLEESSRFGSNGLASL